MLVLLFLLILAYEGYLLYSKVYANLSIGSQDIIAGSVVRLDLNAYNKMLKTIDNNKTFIPTPPVLSNPNPFK